MTTGSEGRKDDRQKMRPSLLPWEALPYVVQVLEYGAQRYGDGNWRSVEPHRYEEALLRHVIEYGEGHRTDDESRLRTIAHIACNALFLLWFEVRKPPTTPGAQVPAAYPPGSFAP